MTEKLPQSMDELLADIDREWSELWRVARQLTPAQMITPDAGGWSPKDNLVHLGEWMNALMGYHMDRRPSHEVMNLPVEVTRDWDFEVINQALFERNRLKSAEEIVAYVEGVYAALVQKLRATPFETLMQPRFADDPDQRPLLLWVLGDTTEHFAEHRLTLQKML